MANEFRSLFTNDQVQNFLQRHGLVKTKKKEFNVSILFNNRQPMVEFLFVKKNLKTVYNKLMTKVQLI